MWAQVSKTKKKAWQHIADSLNASGICGQRRTVEELKKKKETWFSSVKKKVALYFM